uniref:ANF_receptor domain-containing protein n=1 Tax=Steinernema glaseri TaxID=37863 RepID=A0A1I8A350_9BILA
MGCATLLILLHVVAHLVSGEIRLGLIESDPRLVRACDFAIRKARADGVCRESIVLVNATGCEESKGHEAAGGTANAAKLLFEENISGIVSSRCADESWEISRLSYFENIPVINRIGSSRTLLNNEQNPTTVATATTTVVGFAMAISKIMQFYNFTSYDIVTSTSNIHDKTTTDEFLAVIDLNSRLIVLIGDTKAAGHFYTKIDLNLIVTSGFMFVFACEDAPEMCVSECRDQVRNSRTLLLTHKFDDGAATFNEILKNISFEPLATVINA